MSGSTDAAAAAAVVGGSGTSGDAPTTVSCERVSRWFGSVVAVSDVSFAVGPGVTALLGPNGAGKSTLLRMIVGLLKPSAGQVRLLGVDARADRSVRSRIGYVSQHDGLFERQSALEFVALAAALRGVADPQHAARTALGRLGLDPGMTRCVAEFSKGMRQRTKMAAALVHDPQVLIADEPLNGLDPLQRRDAIALLRELGDRGVTVIVSSHVLDEVERIGSDVVVIAQGRLAATGDYRSLRALMANRPHRVVVRASRTREMAGAIIAMDGVVGVRIDDDAISVDLADPDAFGRAVAPAAQRVGATLREVAPADDDLESVFRYIVER